MDLRVAEHKAFDVGGDRYALVVDSSALFLLPPAIAELLRGRVAGDPLPSAGLDGPTRDELLDLGLARDDGAPPAPAPTPDDDRLSTLVLMLARDCTLRCDYCYASPGTPRPGPARMSPRTARAAVDLLFASLPPRGPAGVTMFGGEPLLAMDALEAAAARAQQWSLSLGRELRFSVTTNGTRVDDAVVELLAAMRARVTVSIDGAAARHDAVRRSAAGDGSHAAAVAALQRLSGRCDVGVRATLSARHPDPEAVFDELRAVGAARIGLATADVDGGALGGDAGALDAQWAGMQRLAQRYRREALAGRSLGWTNLDGLLRTIHRGTVRHHPCGAALRLAACDTDGALYACHRLVGRPRHAIGDLERGIDVARRCALARALSLDGRPGCARCWARHLCGGGCHHLHELAGARRGATDADPLPSCGYVRRWIEGGLRLYAELAARRPDFLAREIVAIPPCPVEL